jgi:hypothetical protein
MPDKKCCSKCQQVKLISEFHPSKMYKDGYRGQCRKCRADATKDWRGRFPEKIKLSSIQVRKANIKYRYNLTQEQYEVMLKAQNGVCAICGESETWENQYGKCNLSVDHDHTTGKVRGLICNACNNLVGLLENNPDLPITEALVYLKKHSANHVI